MCDKMEDTMREIKFRAWLKETKEMIPVYQIDFNNGIINSESAWRMESEYILEQFTGLHDRNGVEIYEGDKVSDGENIMIVSWDDKFASFALLKRGWMYKHFFSEAVDAKDCEVIGKIHDNPELLS